MRRGEYLSVHENTAFDEGKHRAMVQFCGIVFVMLSVTDSKKNFNRVGTDRKVIVFLSKKMWHTCRFVESSCVTICQDGQIVQISHEGVGLPTQ